MLSTVLEVYTATYDGYVAAIFGDSDELWTADPIQISTNSIKSISIGEKYLLAGGFSQELYCLTPPNLQSAILDDGENIITCMSTVGRTAMVGFENGNIQQWNTEARKKTAQFRVHKKPISKMQVLGKKVMVSVGGSKMIIWSIHPFQKKHEYKLNHEPQSIVVAEDMSYIVMATQTEVFEICTSTNQQKQLLTIPNPHKIQCMVMMKGKYVLMGTDKGAIVTYRLGEEGCSVRSHYECRVKCMQGVEMNGEDYLVLGMSTGEVSLWGLKEYLEGGKNDAELLRHVSTVSINQRIIAMDCRVCEGKESEQQEVIEEKAEVVEKEKDEEQLQVKVTRQEKVKKQNKPIQKVQKKKKKPKQ